MAKKVAIILGSKSDLERMKPAEEVFKDFGVEFELKILSAHRAPNLVKEYVLSLESRGFEAVIAAAGMAAHLPGVVASLTTLPVIGVPLSATFQGLDSLLSIVQMPPGVPVATMAVDGAKNAALFACQILALSYPELRQQLKDYKQGLEESFRG